MHLTNQKNIYIPVYFDQDTYIQVKALQLYYYPYLTIYNTKKTDI